jgi:hypothetical protein
VLDESEKREVLLAAAIAEHSDAGSNSSRAVQIMKKKVT